MSTPQQATDHELMHRCQFGDALAFAELVRRWQGPVGRLVGHLLGPRAEVDDVCQEVFVRVLRARDRYRPRGAFSTWIYRITLNAARDNRRSRRRRPWQPLEEHDPAAAAPAPADVIAGRERDSAVAEAVAALPTALREVLVLKHFGHLTFAEVAAALDVPPSTAKSRMQAALLQLRQELRRRGVEE